MGTPGKLSSRDVPVLSVNGSPHEARTWAMPDLERPILDFIHAMAASTDLMQHPALVVAGKTILLQQADQTRQVLFKGDFVSIPRVCEQGAQ